MESACSMHWNYYFSERRSRWGASWRHCIQSTFGNLQCNGCCMNSILLCNTMSYAHTGTSSFDTNNRWIIFPSTWICGYFGEIAENRLDLFISHHRVKTAEGVADLPQIHAGLWSSADDPLPGAFKSTQRVDTERAGQLSPTEIEASYRKETLAADDSCYEKHYSCT